MNVSRSVPHEPYLLCNYPDSHPQPLPLPPLLLSGIPATMAEVVTYHYLVQVRHAQFHRSTLHDKESENEFTNI